MHSGSGCHVWGVGPQRLAQGEHRGHQVDMRVAEDRAQRLQIDLGGECHPAACLSKVQRDSKRVSLYFKIRTSDKYDVNYI